MENKDEQHEADNFAEFMDRDLEQEPVEKIDKVKIVKSNLPAIALISGIALFLFMGSATVGLFGYILMNRPTTDSRLEQIDLSRISSSLPESAKAAEQNGADIEIVEGSAPGLYKVEIEGKSEVVESGSSSRTMTEGATRTNISALPELPVSYYENRLSRNINSSKTPPALTHEGIEYRGPQRVQFIVGENGNLHDHALGTATFAETDIVGAAGEWQVRPWWQPAWVPQTVDCGSPGTVAIGGHVSWSSRPGPFHDLGAMVAGDRIRCQSNTGKWYTYEVSEVVQIGYNNTEYYWETRSDLNDHQLTLFTCKPGITGIIVVRAQLINL